MVNIALGVKKSLGIKSTFGIADRIHNKNITDETPKQLSSSTLRVLADYFENDIQTLTNLLNKDFSKWNLNK